MSRYQRRDRFFEKAKEEKFAARSVYKLEEIDRRFRLIKKGQRLVDLGCAPGSWLQYLAEAIGPKGALVGYDLAPAEVSAGPNVATFLLSVDDLSPERVQEDLRKLLSEPAGRVIAIDGLLSDMAPKLTGIRDADQAKSCALAETALVLSAQIVRPGGFFVAKMFQGRDTDGLIATIKANFAEVRLLKPEATRDGSREVFVIGRERRA